MRPQSTPLSPNLSSLLLQARSQRAAIEAEAARHVRSHRIAPKTGRENANAGADSGEFADPRRRELCASEIEAARVMGLV